MEHILIVENEPTHSSPIKRRLEEELYSVTVAPKLKWGKAQLRRWQLPKSDPDYRDFAVVIIDMDFDPEPGQEVPALRPNELGMQVFAESLENPFIEPIIVTGFPAIKTAIRAAN